MASYRQSRRVVSTFLAGGVCMGWLPYWQRPLFGCNELELCTVSLSLFSLRISYAAASTRELYMPGICVFRHRTCGCVFSRSSSSPYPSRRSPLLGRVFSCLPQGRVPSSISSSFFELSEVPLSHSPAITSITPLTAGLRCARTKMFVPTNEEASMK